MLLSAVCLLLANIILFMSVFDRSEKKGHTDHYTNFFLGVGCFCAWIGNLKTLSLFPGFDMVNRTFGYAAKDILWFIFGISPIFLAYVYSGWCMYHNDERLATLDLSYITLMALFAGDELMELFFGTDEFPLSAIWGYSFCILILTFIASVVINIIESNFERVKCDIIELEQRNKLEEEEKAQKYNFF